MMRFIKILLIKHCLITFNLQPPFFPLFPVDSEHGVTTDGSSHYSGEYVIIGAGEVHLQRCIDDLKERFACIQLNVSAPIVPFRETVIEPPKMDMVNEAVVNEPNSAQSRQTVAAAAAGARDQDEETSNQGVVDREKGLIEIKTANKLCSLRIRVMPLPAEVARFLDEQTDLIKLLISLSSSKTSNERKQKEDNVCETFVVCRFLVCSLCC